MHESGGLREQKRAATRLAIEKAVLELTREHGVGAVTVDEISRIAQVSPRTFFNYFASKEDALAGGTEPFHAPDAAVARFLSGDGDHLGALMALLAASVDGLDAQPDLHALRREVFQRYPELLGLRVAAAKQLQLEVAAIAAQRIRAADARLTDVEVERRADMLALVGFALVRSGWMRWAETDGRTPLGECVLAAHREFAATCLPAAALVGAPA